MRRLLYNPGPDSVVYDQAGHQADPGLFDGDTTDDVTAGHLAAGRLLAVDQTDDDGESA